MRYIITLALLLLPLSARADVIGVADIQAGRIYFYSDYGQCKDGAKRAVLGVKYGSFVEGCWINQPDVLRVVFFNAEFGTIPHSMLKKADAA